MRKVLSIAMLLLCILGINAQPQPQELPLNPKVKHGKLSNGLHYYILHNEEPKNRANFYIAQKVGSTLETKEQLGLAHFLEHMAFNGTKNFPGKNLLNYLQNKGIRFGADINAYTAFDETVYNINNVPTTDQNLMDSCLLALRDWSCDIALLDDEIEAERGVIQEEWRSSNDANQRFMSKLLKDVYSEYQYQQTPIGEMEVVMNFKPEVLRDYYHKWYRPDLQGIVIVGDFDAEAMEAKVKEMFSSIPMPKNAPERKYASVSDNKKPIFSAFEDPELQMSRVMVSFKSDKLPWEYRNTDQGYVLAILFPQVIADMINNRLSEYSNDPECPYAYAGVNFGDFLVSKTKDAFDITIIPKDDMEAATKSALGIVARACKTGFTITEYQRATDEIKANYEKAYNERDKTNSNTLAKEIIRHFVDNEPAPGAELEYQFASAVLSDVNNVYGLNELAKQVLTAENQVISISQPQKDGSVLLTADVMEGLVKDALDAKYEAYVDEVITDPLIPQLPAPGKVNKVEDNAALGTTVFTLSNGVKVVVKPTDFAADQVILTAFKNGGKTSYAPSQAADVNLMPLAFELSKIGQFDVNTLKKYLAGKRVGLGYNVGNYTNYFSGQSTVKDLPTLMELIYASFTDVNPDEKTYQAQVDQYKSILANQDKNPEVVMGKHIQAANTNGNPMSAPLDVATLEKGNYNNMLNLIKQSTANAADYTFIFTGNVDAATLRPLLEQYIATLPVALRKKVKQQNDLSIVKGQVADRFKQTAQTPSVTVYDVYSDNNLPFSVDNCIKMDIIGDILGNIFINTLREEEGGTYSPSAGGSYNPSTGQWSLVYYFQTNPDQADKMIARADAELKKLLSEGASETDFAKVKEAAVKQYENSIRNNSYWDSMLLSYERGFDMITGYKAALENLTLADLNTFMKNLYNGNNRIQVIMDCVAE